MRTIILSLLLVTAIVGCGYAMFDKEGAQRYVVYEPDDVFEIEQSKPSVLTVKASDFRDKIVHEMKYVKGYVMELTPLEAKVVKSNFAAKVELDVKHSINIKGCDGDGPPDVPDKPQPPQTTPWGVTAVKAPDSWQTTRGRGSVICVADTGIEDGHADLRGQVIGGFDGTGVGFWQDDHGHGTHVAGTVAALDNNIGVVGVCPECKLFAAKVLNSRGSGYSSWIADGIRSCIDAGADVISMSLGSNSPSDVIHDAVKAAAVAGIWVVSAAGNDGGRVGWPAAFEESLAISAVDSRLRLASFSNRGPEIDFAGPGVAVLSTVKGNDYDTYSGTSMATPHVSAVIGLMLSAGKLQPRARDLGLPSEHQGQGLIDALLTVQ